METIDIDDNNAEPFEIKPDMAALTVGELALFWAARYFYSRYMDKMKDCSEAFGPEHYRHYNVLSLYLDRHNKTEDR